MTSSDMFLNEQKERLLQEKQRLEGDLARIAKKDSRLRGDFDATFPEYGRDPESNAQEEETYEARLGLEQSLETHLQEVHAALARLDAGTYGRCVKCNTEIDRARLTAFPAAATCLEHASVAR